jgi:Fe-Mn family superoxide dismutase
VWNHDFYWHSMTPGGRRPSRAFARLIEQDFGSFDKLRDTFLSVGGSHFGSGWVWLVLSGAGLEVVDTHDAGCPLAGGGIPLLTVDLWEHAYYLDRKSDRGAYLEDVFDQLLDWSFAERNAERTGLVEVQ